ncbi:MAG TPA: sugar phosphate isomerase/epimerase [Candidatus Hydrogenedentes bacterium]|nr:sugar phosphate isomerase/epimerase [Candidatus Hydrogenedentota bacterium]HPC18151.1 sugar phosphate isomerase/epimerase [Candidatus Hydrogenedentota bacterium]HRT21839.1 sugar phosphate isomerase/epimerase [Candidatus Hydrogenedentota bacterium]HRT66559.1 sugar phosphate isomerase/epimerase [Candidatus Hydrogenedentota bacterium]
MDRRRFLQTGLGAGLAVTAASAVAQTEKKTYQAGKSPWPIVLNASTIRPAPLTDKIRVAAEAGYDGIELWVNELEEFESEGGDLKALGAEIRDKGLFVPNVIGLWDSMPMEQEAWEKSLEATRRRMRMSSAVGSQHVAAIPAPDRADFDLKIGAQRYRDLLKIGRDEFNIIVACEFVGFLKGVHRLGQGSAIALDANDPDACLVADTFHLYRGGSGFDGLAHLNGNFIAVFHWNDVPADPPVDQLGDAHRIYPGDGVLPLKHALGLLRRIDYRGPLSLEMFNREHWKQDPLVVAKTGLEKILALMD